MSTNYLVGQVARLSVAITDMGGAAADPGALRLKVKTPAGVTTTYTVGAGIVHDGVGANHFDLALSEVGTWAWRWEADAPNAGADEGLLYVNPSRVI